MATPTTLPASFVSGAVLTAAQMNNLRGAFRTLQVLQTTKLDTFTTTSTTYTDVTGLSVTITPSDTTSKVLIIAQVAATVTYGAGASCNIQLAGGNSGTYVGGTAGSRVRAALSGSPTASSYGVTALPYQTIMYLDSPATTSATTYKVQVRTGTSGTVCINRTADDTDSAQFGRSASSITVMEISA